MSAFIILYFGWKYIYTFLMIYMYIFHYYFGFICFSLRGVCFGFAFCLAGLFFLNYFAVLYFISTVLGDWRYFIHFNLFLKRANSFTTRNCKWNQINYLSVTTCYSKHLLNKICIQDLGNYIRWLMSLNKNKKIKSL